MRKKVTIYGITGGKVIYRGYEDKDNKEEVLFVRSKNKRYLE